MKHGFIGIHILQNNIGKTRVLIVCKLLSNMNRLPVQNLERKKVSSFNCYSKNAMIGTIQKLHIAILRFHAKEKDHFLSISLEIMIFNTDRVIALTLTRKLYRKIKKNDR